jgi:hypothetical protein
LATEQQLIELIKTAVKKSKTEIEIFYEDLTEQTDQFGYFEKLLKKDDLVFSFGARKNAVNWMPYYDKLPAKIATRLKDNNFIIAYPGILYDEQALNHAGNIIKPKEF